MVDAKLLLPPTRFVDIYEKEYILRKESAPLVTVIDRETGSITSVPVAEKKIPGVSTNLGKSKDIYGVFGIIQLLGSRYLIVTTEANLIGKIKSASIFQVAKVEFLSYNGSAKRVDPKDREFINMIESLITTQSFYFSYDYDLTLNTQRIYSFNKQEMPRQIWQRAEFRYFWNCSMMRELITAKAHDWIVPVMSGYILIHHCNIKNYDFDYVLITRRDHRRSGTRFNTRGIDKDGNSANFAETEQIVIMLQNDNYQISSYIETRGSIPLIWTQKPNLKWAPKPKIKNGYESGPMEATRLHFKDLAEMYGEHVLVNLIDQKGSQGRMGNAFKHAVEKVNDKRFKYVWFDFHHECRKMQWHNLSKLIAKTDQDLEKFGFFYAEMHADASIFEARILQRQNGCFRTNCMDSCDRTNVVQSEFARNILHRQLFKLAITKKEPSGQAFEPFSGDLEQIFRNAWCGHGDTISFLYSGTGALKTDFTKTGKRTTAGALNDGRNSLTRYFLNNFCDGYRQDSLDVFLGRYLPHRNPKKQRPKSKSYMRIPIVSFALVIFSFFAYGYLHNYATGGMPTENSADISAQEVTGFKYYKNILIPFILLQGVLLGVFVKGVQATHSLFVDKPQLTKDDQFSLPGCVIIYPSAGIH